MHAHGFMNYFIMIKLEDARATWVQSMHGHTVNHEVHEYVQSIAYRWGALL